MLTHLTSRGGLIYICSIVFALADCLIASQGLLAQVTIQPVWSTPKGHTSGVLTSNFNSASDRVVTTSYDETAKIWNASTGALISTLSGHNGWVNTANFNSAGNRIVTASNDSTAKIWNASTGALIATMSGHTDVIWTAKFNSAGDRIVTASKDRTAKIWNASTGALITTLRGHTDNVTNANFNSAGDRIVTASDDHTAKIWDASTGALIATLSGHTFWVEDADFNSAGDRIVTASYDATAKIWNASTGALIATLSGHTTGIHTANFNNAGDRIVTASWDSTAKIWNASTGALIATLSGHKGPVNTANFNSAGDRVVTASWDSKAKIWNASTGAIVSTLNGHTSGIEDANFNSTGDRVVTAGDDYTAKIWNASTGALIATLGGHTNSVQTANFNSTGDRVVTASDDKTAKIWNASTGAHIATLSGHSDNINEAKFNSSGDRVVTASWDSTAKIWNANTGALISTLKGHTRYVNTASFNSTGDLVVTASADSTAKIWNASAGSLIVTLSGHTSWLQDANFNNAGDRLVTASFDNTAKIWNASTGALIATLNHTGPVQTANFNSTGDRVVTASADNTAKIWNASTGALISTLSGHALDVNTAKFNIAGDRIVTASSDNTAKIWNATTGTLIATLSGHTGHVITATFNSAGDQVVTACVDNTAKIWNASNGALIATLSGHTRAVKAANFNGADNRIVTASSDWTAKMWDISGLQTPNPKLSIANLNTSICSGSDTLIKSSVSPSTSGLVWKWTLADGSTIPPASLKSGGTASDSTIRLAPSATQSYKVAISKSGVTLDSLNFTINVNPLPKPTINGIQSFCSNKDSVVYRTAFNSGSSYFWSILNGSAAILGASSNDSVIIRASVAGEVILQVRETTPNGCSKDTTFQISVLALPNPNIQGLTGVCSGQTDVSYSTTKNVGSSYVWSILSGAAEVLNASEEVAHLHFSAIGKVLLQVRETNASGCSKDTTISISVSDSLKPVISSATGFNLCAGGDVTLDAGSGTSYQWSRDGSTINGATQRTYNANQAGNYSVHVTSGACSGTSDLQAVVAAVSAQPRLLSAGTKDICQGDSIVLSLHPGAYSGYTWSTGQSSSSITVFAAGVYYCSVDSAGCTSRSDSLIVNLNPKPTPTIVNAGSTLSTQSFEGYQWLDSNSVAISGATNQQYQPLVNGYYTVIVSKGGCLGVSNRVYFGASGPSTLVLDDIEFGSVPYDSLLKEVGVLRSSVIHNHGSAEVIIDTIVSDQKVFHPTDYKGLRVPAYDSLVLAVRFAPTGLGDYGGQLRLITTQKGSATSQLHGAGRPLRDKEVVCRIQLAPSVTTVNPGDTLILRFKLLEEHPRPVKSDMFKAYFEYDPTVLSVIEDVNHQLDTTGRWNKQYWGCYIHNPRGEGVQRMRNPDGTILQMRFIAKLCAVDSTRILFTGDSAFYWIQKASQLDTAISCCTDSVVHIRVCTEGGEKRLVAKSPGTSVTMIAPNPGHGTFDVNYSIGEDTEAELFVSDVQGRRVWTQEPRTMHLGSYATQLNTKNWPSGLYLLVLRTPLDYVSTKLLVVE